MDELKPSIGISDDYATASMGDVKFYYGYEHSLCDECRQPHKPGRESCDNHEDAGSIWCFVATFEDREIVIPSDKMKSEQWDVTESLLEGICWVFARYQFARRKKSLLEDE